MTRIVSTTLALAAILLASPCWAIDFPWTSNYGSCGSGCGGYEREPEGCCEDQGNWFTNFFRNLCGGGEEECCQPTCCTTQYARPTCCGGANYGYGAPSYAAPAYGMPAYGMPSSGCSNCGASPAGAYPYESIPQPIPAGQATLSDPSIGQPTFTQPIQPSAPLNPPAGRSAPFNSATPRGAQRLGEPSLGSPEPAPAPEPTT
jgi:hypothetical protein